MSVLRIRKQSFRDTSIFPWLPGRAEIQLSLLLGVPDPKANRGHGFVHGPRGTPGCPGPDTLCVLLCSSWCPVRALLGLVD